MRFLWIRCLVVLLSLALVCGNAHAALHLGGAYPEPCPEEHAHHIGKTSPHHQHQHGKALACCCDCLGCTSPAYLPPHHFSRTPGAGSLRRIHCVPLRPDAGARARSSQTRHAEL